MSRSVFIVRIGFVRFNNPVELDLNLASPHGAGCEIRSSLLVDLVYQGHEVYILQYVPPKHRIWERISITSERERYLAQLNYVSINSYNEYNVSRLDLDVLLIECGPTNTRFSFKENSVEMPFIRRTFLALKDYEGDVVYYQHDIALPFPFGECLRDVKESYVMGLSKINLTRMTWELGREKLFFGNKRWIILHNTLNEEFFIKYCSTKRYKYEHFIREGLMKTRYITQLLVSHCDIEEMGMEPNSNPKYDLMYVGKEKDKFRTQLILQYYDSPKIRSCIIGKWKSKPWKHIEYLGVRGKQGETIRFYNSALATVFVPTEYMKKGGILTSRITQALLGGCVVFIHNDIYGIEKLVDPRIQNVCIVTPSEFEDKLEVLKSVDLETRKFIVELERKYLLKRYCDFDWNRLLHW